MQTRRRFLANAGLAWFIGSSISRAELAGREQILVLGAGAAGLAAARDLKAQGFDVTILEGRDRLGGRILTDNSLGAPIDLGASFVHGVKRNPILELCKEWSVPSVPFDKLNGVVYARDGKPLTSAQAIKYHLQYERLQDQAAAATGEFSSDTSLEQGLQRVLSKPGRIREDQDLIDWGAAMTAAEMGEDPIDLSLRHWDEGEEYFGGDHVLTGGYGRLISGLAKGLDVRINERVRRIERKDLRVRVVTESRTYEADRVVVTFPLGVLQADAVEFSPPLPAEKTAAIKRLHMGVLSKIVLRFPERFWPSKNHFLGFMGEKGRRLPFVMNMIPFVGTPILVGFVGGSMGRELERLSLDEGKRVAMSLLRQAFGTATLDPDGALMTRWSTDPFSLGSYSHLPVGASGADRDLLAEPIAGRLFFAGEAAHRNCPSTVKGAILSGRREAARIAKLLG